MSTERPGVYAITHLASGRSYVGSTTNLSKRWSRHRQELRDGIHRNAHLQAAWELYGAEAFAWRILAICEPAFRIELEQRFIDGWDLTNPDRGFNRAAIASVSYGGAAWERTPEWRHMQAQAWKLRRPPHQPGAKCAKGHVKDGSYTRRMVGRTGLLRVKVRCQECERTSARERNRKARGIPTDHPRNKHFNRRKRAS